MDTSPQLLDVVALVEDLPRHGLRRGQVGTVVEMLAPGVFEVEFSDDDGCTYALLPLRAEQLTVLQYRRVALDEIRAGVPCSRLREHVLMRPASGRRRPRLVAFHEDMSTNM